MPGHLRTMKVWLPSRLISFSILFCITRMAVMTTMMEKTPTRTPSSVRADLSLCAAMAPMAMRMLSFSSEVSDIWPLFISQCVNHIHPGRSPCWQKTRDNAGDQGDQERDRHNERGQCRRD